MDNPFGTEGEEHETSSGKTQEGRGDEGNHLSFESDYYSVGSLIMNHGDIFRGPVLTSLNPLRTGTHHVTCIHSKRSLSFSFMSYSGWSSRRKLYPFVTVGVKKNGES